MTTGRESTPQDQVDVGPGAAYDLTLSVAGWMGQLGDFLHARSAERAGRLLDVYTRLTSVPAAFAELGDFLDWVLTGFDLPAEVAQLARYAKRTAFSGVEAALSGDGDSASNQARLLMEVEFLLRDFAASPERVERWAGVTPFERSKQFSFAAMRKRLERERGITDGYTLPDRAEYQAHSATAHPSPPDPSVQAPDRVTDLFLDLGDLLIHLDRVLRALLELLGVLVDPDDDDEVPDPPGTEAVKRAFAEIEAYVGRLPGYPLERQPIPLRWDEDIKARIERALRDAEPDSAAP